MTHSRRLAMTLLPLLCLGLACFGSSKKETHSRHTPEVQTGAGASIIWPGQAPAMPYPAGRPPAPSSAGPPGVSPAHPPANPPHAGTTSGGGGFTYLGGAAQEEEQNRKEKSKAVGTPDVFLLNVITAPLAAVGALIAKPFLHDRDGREAAKQAVPEPSGALPSALQPQASAPPVDPQVAHERAQLDAMERELAARRGALPPEHAQTPALATRSQAQTRWRPRSPQASAAPAGPQRGAVGALSIAAELAALRRPVGASDRATTPPTAAPGTSPAPPPLPPQGVPADEAEQRSDRNHDGRPDYWATRASGQLVKEVFDDNGDGRPDKIVRYDRVNGEELSEEQDTNGDGRMDSWTEYQGGVPARARRDSNFDGHLDTWSFYRGGQLARQEQDTNGDGFRNRLAVYKAGRLVREEIDRDGDGRVESVTLYDTQERPARKDEDRDGDGLIDTRSIYENGRLARREFVNEDQLQQPIEGRALGTAAWETGPEKR